MEKVKGILNEEDFLKWVKEKDSERDLAESDYRLLFGYLEGHGYALYVDNENCLYRIDVDDEGTIMYSIDEMIKDVSHWNCDMIEQSDDAEILKEQEKALDRMYLTTKIGKMIQSACRKIAEEGV